MSDRESPSVEDWTLDEEEFSAVLGTEPDDDAPLHASDAAPDEVPAAPDDDSPAPTASTAAHAASAEGSPSGFPSAPAEPPVARTPSLTTEGFTPPTGEPFAFTVDGQQVAVDGAVVAGDYIVIPKAVWDRQIRPNHLADRRVWREKERAYATQLQQAQQGFDERVARADAILAKVAELNAAGPEAWAQWLDQFQQNAPLLEAQARELAARQQLQRIHAMEAERAQSEYATQLVPVLKQHLDRAVDQALALDDYKLLAPDAEALKHVLWAEEAERLFFVPERDDPAMGWTAGQVAFRTDVFQRLLDRQALSARRLGQQAAQVAEAAKRNQAATGARSAKARPVRSTALATRDPETGQFTKASARNWKEQLLDEDWSDLLEE